MGIIRDTIEVANDHPVAQLIGLAGSIDFTTTILIGVTRYTYDSVWNLVKTPDGKRKYTCSLCGEPDHNRRGCEHRVTCDNCGEDYLDSYWEYEGVTVCTECVDSLN